jgi:cytochrome c oxidase subunit IV
MTKSHITPVRVYVSVFLTLIALTVATTLISRVDLGEFNFVVALTIAVIKASLVVWFFMHVNHSSSMTRLFVFAGLFWLAIMLVFVMSDYVSRGWLPGSHWL